MTNTPHRLALIVALASFAVLASAPLTAAATPPAHAPRSIYRFDISLTGVEDGAHAAPVTYTLILQEEQSGALSAGANVPLVTASAGGTSPRQDVGLSLHFSYSLRGSVVVLVGGLELSSIDAPASGGAATIRRVRAEGVAPIPVGPAVLFSSVYDPASGRRIEIHVSAQRLL